MGVVVKVATGHLSMPYKWGDIEHCISKSESSVVLRPDYFEAYIDV